METIGTRIRSILEQNEISQKTLAKRISVSPTAMNNYIQDIRNPPLDVLGRICDELHCSADYLLGRQYEPIVRLTEEEMALIRAWRKTMDEDLKALIRRSLGISEQKKKAI